MKHNYTKDHSQLIGPEFYTIIMRKIIRLFSLGIFLGLAALLGGLSGGNAKGDSSGPLSDLFYPNVAHADLSSGIDAGGEGCGCESGSCGY